mgnify:CR=1 FL=1
MAITAVIFETTERIEADLARLGAETIRTDPVEAYHPILEVRRATEGLRLVLNGGLEVDASSVTALRVP